MREMADETNPRRVIVPISGDLDAGDGRFVNLTWPGGKGASPLEPSLPEVSKAKLSNVRGLIGKRLRGNG
jgi:hypothetical protein